MVTTALTDTTVTAALTVTTRHLSPRHCPGYRRSRPGRVLTISR
jgi:hypothetical protein